MFMGQSDDIPKHAFQMNIIMSTVVREVINVLEYMCGQMYSLYLVGIIL